MGLAAAFPRSRRFGFYKMGWWNYKEPRQVEQPMAASLLLRRSAIESCGGLFDEDFPIYFNDVDLCRRLADAGWPLWYLPEARVRHWGGASTNQRRVAMIAESHRSLLLYYHKHYRKQLPRWLYLATCALITVTGRVRVALAARGSAK
jgi:GT2 family glycosyltransferase